MTTTQDMAPSPLASICSDSICISVVIPVRNEETVIGRCLKALVENKFPKGSFEIIVVDNGSTDRTLEVVRSFQSVINLSILVHAGAHISALRNLGACSARGAVLAFLDADCITPENWLEEAALLLREPGNGVVGAHYQIPVDSTWVGRIWYEDRFASKIGDVSYIPSGNLIVRREDFVQVGGFDETIQTNEDFEFCQRALASGLSVRSYPTLRVLHLGTPRSLLSFYRKQRWHGTHVVTIFLRDRQRRRNLRPILLACYTLLCLGGLLVGSLTWSLGRGWDVAIYSAVLLAFPLFLIALGSSIRRKKPSDVFALTLLYLTFGIARAFSLLNFTAWANPLRHTSRTSPIREKQPNA